MSTSATTPARPEITLNRRSFLHSSAFIAGVVAFGSPLLAACGGGATAGAGAGGAGGTAAVALPDFTSALKVTPDLVGNAAGLQDGFLSPITKYYESVTGEIASGGDVTSLVLSYSPPAPPLAQNTWWRAVNERTNMNYMPQVTPAGDFVPKFSTVTAGNELPDLVQMPLMLNLPRVADLLKTRFTDLSDYLSGSKVNTYPNLAGIPTYSWNMARVNGRIYGVPLSRPVYFSPMFARQDILDELGVERPTNAEEFEDLCKAITDVKGGRWAMGSASDYMFNVPFFAQMYGAPMKWKANADGTLVKDFETEEFAKAVEFANKLRVAGYFHPDSAAFNQSQATEQFSKGAVVLYMAGLAGWRQTLETQSAVTPGFNQDAMVPFGYDGGPGTQFFDTGIFSLTAITKADKARVEEMLRVLNYFAAPFGSKEYLLNTAGVEGVDHTIDASGQVALTDQGKLEQGMAFNFVMSGAPVLTSGTQPDYVKQCYAWQEKVVSLGVSDPTNGLNSETNSKVGGQLGNTFNEGILNIVSGRGSLGDLPALVASWKSGGGDTIRQEFQDALAASK